MAKKQSREERRNDIVEAIFNDLPRENRRLLERIRERLNRVGVSLHKVEVRFDKLRVEANCEVINGKPLPTLFNAVKTNLHALARGTLKTFGFKTKEIKITILRNMSGIIKPSRMTLLLGPPGSGKTTLLRALASGLDHSLQVEGLVSYNGFKLDEFIPQKTAVYVSQNDLHIPEMTVRETFDFSARCQGVGRMAEIVKEIEQREKEAGIAPDPVIEAYMKELSIGGSRRSIQTDYILKILGLDICSGVIVGDAMRRGISGGEKRRVTLGEMIVGQSRTFFMDEISNGLDSSTAFQILSCLQHSVHIMETTALVSLLQPDPEIFNLFDDVILMAEGRTIYHGPRDRVLEFFESCGFKCPERKSPADFLHEVISKKDQAQYWYHPDLPYHYVSVEQFSQRFNSFSVGEELLKELSRPLSILKDNKDALSFSKYSLSKRQLFRACCSREWLLARRSPHVYVMRSIQLFVLAIFTMTVFLRTRMGVDAIHANLYMGSLFFLLLMITINNNPEMTMILSRLPVFYKQRNLYFYPAWAFSLPSSVLKIPHSVLAAFLLTSLTYFVIGYSPEASRFFCQFLLLFEVHLLSGSQLRALASVFRTYMAATVAGSFATFASLSLGGFVLPLPYIPSWMSWTFWLSPLSYAEIGITVNEFRSTRWKKISSGNESLGEKVMRRRGILYEDDFYWISLGGLFGYIVLLITIYTLALTYLRAPSKSRAMISSEKLSQLQDRSESIIEEELRIEPSSDSPLLSNVDESRYGVEKKRGKMILPFEPVTLSFENVQYFVEVPQGMKGKGATHKQLLRDITGAFRPHVLTALMGASGAGKTTLFDVLSGRKTVGTIYGDIRVRGYPKVQDTFSRISGYCEQSDIHSSNITVEESVIHSAWLRLGSEISNDMKNAFVNEVLETIELDEIKDTLVGSPGISGLSIEQRKRLTFAVELVANPSIMFIDEPTTGLDARTAAIVMRVVKNVVNTGRTVVCTIHQPSVSIFESFDELVLIKKGGQIIYFGDLGWHSKSVIDYFEAIPGVPKIKKNYNPATWMLEVTSTSIEKQLSVDFAQVYKDSPLYQSAKRLVKKLSKPPPGSNDLQFDTRFPVSTWGQFTACFWKHSLSYWRAPEYNLKRISFSFVSSLFFGLLFWNRGRTIEKEQDLFNIAGFLFTSMTFLGVNNCQSVQHAVIKERLVMYRERFAGMYSTHAYSIAQIAIEIPYVIIVSSIFGTATYFTIGFPSSLYKFLWYIGTQFFTILYLVYLGMLIISMSPSTQIASVYASSFFTISNLFTGFLIPRP
ncbi:ABC transporter G family member 37-like isoform X3 [Macadamia integrifolia]|nr:ABC transporter G family member 37-like isoform X3 [Macadamia integrifolia]